MFLRLFQKYSGKLSHILDTNLTRFLLNWKTYIYTGKIMKKLLNFFAKIFNEGKTSEDLLAVLGYTLY